MKETVSHLKAGPSLGALLGGEAELLPLLLNSFWSRVGAMLLLAVTAARTHRSPSG